MTGPQLGKEASGVPKADLSGMFAPATAAVPDRTAGVPLLNRAPASPTTPPAEPAPAPVEPAVPAVTTPAPAPADDKSASVEPAAAAAPARRRPRAASRARKHPSAVVVYLPVSLRTRLRAHAASTGRSHTQLVFDALNAVHSRLADLAAADRRPAVDEATDGLFVVQQPVRRSHAGDQVQVSIRPNPTNLAIIDKLAAAHTAGNRSALVTLALYHFLPTTDDEDHARDQRRPT